MGRLIAAGQFPAPFRLGAGRSSRIAWMAEAAAGSAAKAYAREKIAASSIARLQKAATDTEISPKVQAFFARMIRPPGS